MSHIKPAFEGGATVNGNPLQDSCLENSMNREAWQATVDGVEKSRTLLSNHHSLTQHRSGGYSESKENIRVTRGEKRLLTLPLFYLFHVLTLKVQKRWQKVEEKSCSVSTASPLNRVRPVERSRQWRQVVWK